MLLVVLVATAGAAALALLGAPLALPRPALHALAAAVGLVVLALGLLAAGLEARLLLPSTGTSWRMGSTADSGGSRSVDWPYDGADAWIRQTILLGAPLLLAVAATLAFLPARRGAAAPLRAAGL